MHNGADEAIYQGFRRVALCEKRRAGSVGRGVPRCEW